jgi:sterol desaturase/sphingolipid hydroxylase (fatty acid hydroxylase superfamily)
MAPVWRFVEQIVESPLNYWLVFACDWICLAWLFVSGLRAGASVTATVVSAATGFVAWGPLEYAYHRWVLHGPPSFARTSHARHHGDGHALVSTPILVGPLLAIAIRVLLGFVLPPALASFATLGFYGGYVYFAVLHHAEHRGRVALDRVGYWRQLGATHDLHHRRAAVNFGVTTTFWDRVFGTYSAAARPQLRPAAGAGAPPPAAP